MLFLYKRSLSVWYNRYIKRINNTFLEELTMKKIISLLIMIVFLFSVSGCDIVENMGVSVSEHQEALDRIDALEEELFNQYDLFSSLSLETIKSNVMVYTTCRSLTGISRKGGQGSGVIIKEDATSYYVLTNNHVVYCEPSYPRRSYEITDFKMNSYAGEILHFDPDFDLAIVKFPKNLELLVLPFANENPEVNETVIAIGQPEGQINAITFGKVLRYTEIICETCEEAVSNVSFECILHDAAISKGNSGGMLINTKKEIVGINTFGAGESGNGAAVPLEKILEFFSLEGFTLT